MVPADPLIAAVLPTRNRASLLNGALQSLRGQTLARDRYEVVVVDDGSTDETSGAVEAVARELPLRYHFQDHRGIAAAKNRGVQLARAPLVAFLDDDDVFSAALLEEHVRSHNKEPGAGVAVLGRTELDVGVARSPVMRFVTEVGFTLFCYPRLKEGQWLDYAYFWGGRSSCKRAFLLGHGLFDEGFRFGCEDIELGFRLAGAGLRVLYNARAVSTMVRGLSFDQFCERTRRQGVANFRFGQIHPVEEVLRWGKLVGAEARWSEIRPDFEGILRAARTADALAVQRTAEGAVLDRPFLRELHGAYQRAFDACRLKGIMEAAAELGQGGGADEGLGT